MPKDSAGLIPRSTIFGKLIPFPLAVDHSNENGFSSQQFSCYLTHIYCDTIATNEIAVSHSDWNFALSLAITATHSIAIYLITEASPPPPPQKAKSAAHRCLLFDFRLGASQPTRLCVIDVHLQCQITYGCRRTWDGSMRTSYFTIAGLKYLQSCTEILALIIIEDPTGQLEQLVLACPSSLHAAPSPLFSHARATNKTEELDSDWPRYWQLRL